MLKTSWAYALRREELVAHANEFSIDSNGTVEELRKRFAKFISSDHGEDVTQRLLKLQTKYESASSLSATNVRGTSTPSPLKMEGHMPTQTPLVKVSEVPHTPKAEPRVNLMDQVRKWGLNYDGIQDPLAFIERLEELADTYEVKCDLLPKVMPEFLSDRALVWYRNNNAHWQVWKSFKIDFLAFFLPARYFEKLDDDIRSRRQRPNEPFKNYLLNLQNLMRHSSLTEEQKLQRIFQNSHADYQWYIKRKDFSSLAELINMAEDLESINKEFPQAQNEESRPSSSSTNAASIQCYHCGNFGHYASNCPRNRHSGNRNGGRRN